MINLAFVPEFNILLAFIAACFLLALTPGPDMMLFFTKTLEGGRLHGFAALMGAMTGLLGHTLFATIGLTALLKASATAFLFLKWAGALYLLWLAYLALRKGAAPILPDQPAHKADKANISSRKKLKNTYLQGLFINLLNPKIIVFFLTFLPQFVTASDPHAQGKLVLLGLLFIIIGAGANAVLIMGAEHAIAGLRKRPKIMRVIDYLFAGVMGGFAVKLLTYRG